jgi:hypothetical protein
MKLLLKSLIVLFFILPGLAASAQKIDRKLLPGRWQATDDKKSELVFTNDKQIDYYSKKAVLTSNYFVKHDSLIVVDVEHADTLYYAIDKLNAKVLSMTYLSRGNTLEYRRVNSN